VPLENQTDTGIEARRRTLQGTGMQLPGSFLEVECAWRVLPRLLYIPGGVPVCRSETQWIIAPIRTPPYDSCMPLLQFHRAAAGQLALHFEPPTGCRRRPARRSWQEWPACSRRHRLRQDPDRVPGGHRLTADGGTQGATAKYISHHETRWNRLPVGRRLDNRSS
jgi:hypothetical protein